MSTRLATTRPLFPSLLAVKHWSKILSMSARDTTPIAPLLGEDKNFDHPREDWDRVARFRSEPGAIS
jgi:hypothetical protein